MAILIFLLSLSMAQLNDNHIKLHNVVRVCWMEKADKIFLIDGFDSTTGIFKFDIKKKKTFPVFNGDFKIRNISCCISKDERYIGITYYKEGRLRIYDTGERKYICDHNFLKDKKISGIINDGSMGRIALVPYEIDDGKITLFLQYSIKTALENEYRDFFITYNYRTNRISNLSQVPAAFSLSGTIPVTPTAFQRYIIKPLVYCYDIKEEKLKKVLPDKCIDRTEIQKLETGIQVLDNCSYFVWDKSFCIYNIETGELQKIPVISILLTEMCKFIPTRTFIYFSDGRNREFQYHFGMKEIIHYSIFRKIREQGMDLLSISPSGDKVLVYDKKHRRIIWFSVP